MVRRRSTVRFRKGAPAQRRISNSTCDIRGLVHGPDDRFGVILPPWPPPAKVTLRSCQAAAGSRRPGQPRRSRSKQRPAASRTAQHGVARPRSPERRARAVGREHQDREGKRRQGRHRVEPPRASGRHTPRRCHSLAGGTADHLRGGRRPALGRDSTGQPGEVPRSASP